METDNFIERKKIYNKINGEISKLGNIFLFPTEFLADNNTLIEEPDCISCMAYIAKKYLTNKHENIYQYIEDMLHVEHNENNENNENNY
jgi:hypothetical protein